MAQAALHWLHFHSGTFWIDFSRLYLRLLHASLRIISSSDIRRIRGILQLFLSRVVVYIHSKRGQRSTVSKRKVVPFTMTWQGNSTSPLYGIGDENSTSTLPGLLSSQTGNNGNVSGSNGNNSVTFPRGPPMMPKLPQDVLELLKWAEDNFDLIGSIGAMLIVVLGTVGNGLTIAMMRRARMKSSVATVYLLALAVADTGLLWIGAGHWWISTAFKINIRDMDTWLCKFHYFFITYFSMLPAWILVFVTVQRMLIVAFPFKVKVIATRKKAYISLVVLCIALAAYGIYHLIYADLVTVAVVKGRPIRKCLFKREITEFHFKYYNYIALMATLLLPFLSLLIANIVIIVKVIQAKVKREALVSTQSDDGQVRQMTATLISVSVIFLVLNTPYVVVYYFLPPADGTNIKYGIIIAGQFGSLLNSLNSAINFLLYCITGPTFRKELRAMLCRCCGGKAPPGSNSQISSGSFTTKATAVSTM